ncbi:MAG: DUF1285 domain-containing protein [Allopontixanthobacter sediminis]
MPYEAPPELASLTLAQIAEQVKQRKLPPVEDWSPQKTGDSLMRIAADGTWFHDGGEIRRPAMVRAFAGLLTRDAEGRHWLVTPFEKLSIEVVDAAFIAVDVSEVDGGLGFRINTDELVIAGPDNPITARGDPETPGIYVTVRRGLEARLNRSTYQQLLAIALARGDDWTVRSQGTNFALQPS